MPQVFNFPIFSCSHTTALNFSQSFRQNRATGEKTIKLKLRHWHQQIDLWKTYRPLPVINLPSKKHLVVMLGLRTERLIFFSRIFNNLTAIGPELTKNKRNLTVFRSHIQNKHSQFSLHLVRDFSFKEFWNNQQC